MFGIDDFSQKIVDFENFDPSQLKDALLFGGAMVLIGMLTVFSVLIILWACLAVFNLVFHGAGKKNNKAEAAPVAEVVETRSKSATDSELVAVIAAAIAMAEAENSGLKFKVVSFRRK